MKKAYVFTCLAIWAIASCGSGNKSSSGIPGTSSSSSSSSGSNTPPSAAVAIQFNDVNESNANNYSFQFRTAQTNITHRWSFTDTENQSVEGSGSVVSFSTIVSDVDLTTLTDGEITYSILLENNSELTSEPLTGIINKDATPPDAYTLSLPDSIDENNQNNVTLGVSTSAENIGNQYAYTFSTSGSSTAVRGEGAVSAADFTIENIDLSSLNAGTVNLVLTATDDAGNTSVAEASITKTGAPSSITISGTITFDSVPHNSITSGLNYNATIQKPARSVVVRLLDASGTTLESTRTDSLGFYSFVTPPDTNVKVSIEALFAPNDRPSFPSNADYSGFSIKDNTSQNALYVLEGSLSNSGSSSSTRDLHAASGWQNNRYQNPRSAAPFAILDALYDAYQLLLSAAPDLELAGIDIFWSTENQAVSGLVSEGDIGTSYYSDSEIYILGAENNDTDEYDSHVIAHEFGHYVEDAVSRSDSIGGSHNDGDRLDMRVALSEGWGNAFSAMALENATYRDSLGNSQASGFSFDLENNNSFHQGWYSEDSVESILYDLYDSPSTDDDDVADRFDALFSVMRSDAYRNSTYLTGIHLLLSEIKSQHPDLADNIDDLATEQNIIITDARGTGEVNNAGSASSLPIYTNLSAGGEAVEICSQMTYGTYNKLNNRRYILLTVPQTMTYNILVDAGSVSPTADPDFILWSGGQQELVAESTTANRESTSYLLDAGEYVLEVYDYENVGGDGRNICLNVSVN